MLLPLLPVLAGLVVAELVREASDAAVGSAFLAAAALVALALVSAMLTYWHSCQSVGEIVSKRGERRALARYIRFRRARWVAELGAFGLALDGTGFFALMRESSIPVEAATVIATAAWVIVCFATWTGEFLGERRALRGQASLREELASKARRVVVPLLALGAAALALELVRESPPVRELFDLHPRARTLALGANTVLLFGLAPLVVRVLTKSKAIDGASLALPGWLASMKLRFREWDLGSPVATASVAGLFARFRTVFVTPALREALAPDEVAAVIGHEVGHAALGHLRANAALACFAVLVLEDVGGALERLFPGDDAAQLGALLTLVALGGALFCVIARRHEHDADLYALEHSNAETVNAALDAACRANGIEPTDRSPLHPSPRARLDLVARAGLDRWIIERHRRTTKLADLAFVAAASIAAGANVFLLARDSILPLRERLLRAARANLEAGDSTFARKYAARAIELGEDARALVLHARALPANEHDRAAVELERANEIASSPDEVAAVASAREALDAAR